MHSSFCMGFSIWMSTSGHYCNCLGCPPGSLRGEFHWHILQVRLFQLSHLSSYLPLPSLLACADLYKTCWHWSDSIAAIWLPSRTAIQFLNKYSIQARASVWTFSCHTREYSPWLEQLGAVRCLRIDPWRLATLQKIDRSCFEKNIFSW